MFSALGVLLVQNSNRPLSSNRWFEQFSICQRITLARVVGYARPLPAELTFSQQGDRLVPDDPRIKRQVEEGEPRYNWMRWDEGGSLRHTWLAE